MTLQKGSNARTGYPRNGGEGEGEGKCIKINELNATIYLLGMYYVSKSATIANMQHAVFLSNR